MKINITIFMYFMIAMLIYIVGICVGDYNGFTRTEKQCQVELNKADDLQIQYLFEIKVLEREQIEMIGMCSEAVHTLIDLKCPEVYAEIMKGREYKEGFK